MSKYCIIGGNGVFGVHLAQYLLNNEKDAHVSCIGRNPEKAKYFTLCKGIDDKRYKYKQIHMTFEPERLQSFLEEEQPDYIINFAALAADVQSSWYFSTRFYETNVVALARLTDWLIDKKWMKKFIQIGSSEIYGSVTEPVSEEGPIKPTSPYAVSKVAGDMHLRAIHNIRKFPMNIVWPSNAYGSGQQLYRIIPRTILCCLFDKKLPLQGGGKCVKSFIHAQDLADAIHKVIHKAEPGKSYNIGPNEGTSIRKLVETTIKVMDKKFDDVVEMAPDRLGQDAAYLIDSTKIRSELGWKPQISLEEGIKETADWARKYKEELRELSWEVFFQA